MIITRQCLLLGTGLAPPIFASLRDLCGLAVNSFHLVAEYALSGIGKPIAMSLEWPAGLLIMDESSGRAMARNLNIRITETAREILENGRAKSLVALTLTKTRSNR